MKPEPYVVCNGYTFILPLRLVETLAELTQVNPTYDSEAKKFVYTIKNDQTSFTIIPKEDITAMMAANRLENP